MRWPFQERPGEGAAVQQPPRQVSGEGRPGGHQGPQYEEARADSKRHRLQAQVTTMPAKDSALRWGNASSTLRQDRNVKEVALKNPECRT